MLLPVLLRNHFKQQNYVPYVTLIDKLHVYRSTGLLYISRISENRSSTEFQKKFRVEWFSLTQCMGFTSRTICNTLAGLRPRA